MHYIHLDSKTSEIESFLKAKNWLDSNETVQSIEKPGEGNMNVVLRIKTDQRSFILKQSRPFVQKYQQIEAPLNRIDVEFKFYKAIDSKAIESYIPKIIAYDAEDYMMMMEDLGQCEDLSYIYQKRAITESVISKFTSILSQVHQSKIDSTFPENRDLRLLNHQHIFILPFLEDNGFQLDDVQSGLQALSLSYKKNDAIKSVVKKIGDQYLTAGSVLIHGDYYPGSWMQQEENLYIIDPEFSFMGFPEFDLGVMAGHITMANGDTTMIDLIYDQYEGQADKRLMTQVAGIEIMRRLIGLAQLPLERTLEEKDKLLKTATKMVLS